MKKIIVFIFLVISANVLASNNYDIVSFNRCVDGDTAVFNINKEEVKVRFLAIDTPETVSTKVAEEPFGKEASEYTCDILSNATEIILEYEKSKTDKYGRTLAWIWVDGKLLQEDLITKGYAKVAYIYAKYKYTNSLCNIQNEIIEKNIGLWQKDKEIGYCSTAKLELAESNIKYEELKIDEKKYKETLSKVQNVSDKTDQVLDFIGSKKEYYIYAILIIAAIVAIYKEMK